MFYNGKCSQMSRVVIVKGTKPVEMTVKALEKIGSDMDGLLYEKKPILIKPNYINSRHPSTGITTDARVLEGIVKFLRERKVEEIVIGEEAVLQTPSKLFKLLALTPLLKSGV
jgi:uncharacterized protein (DUF362 family)